MLGVAVRKLVTLPAQVLGIVCDLLEKLSDPEWLEASKKFLRKENPWPKQVDVITINRTRPFNPAEFIGEGWSIWRGPADGNGLEGDEEQDERSLKLTEVNFSKVRLETCLKGGESSVKGEEKLKRLKETNCIRLDAKIFQTLWQNQHLIPESWKEKTNGNTTYVFFDGTTLRGPFGRRIVLYLFFRDGKWYWYYCWLEDDWHDNSPSAVLAS